LIRIINPGIYTTVQDCGRVGMARWGIPVSGSMDAVSAAAANAILGNEPSAAVLEITYGQGVYEFVEPLYFCLTGADFSPSLNNEPLKMGRRIHAAAGDVLRFGKREYGARVYLAVVGGLHTPEVLGSKSYFPGVSKTCVQKNDLLNAHSMDHSSEASVVQKEIHPQHFLTSQIDCMPGPEFALLAPSEQKKLCGTFHISNHNNRVGYRMVEQLALDLPAILTSAVLPGTVQLTPSGELIALMRDAPTTGGYPRVLQLTALAISRLSQKIAGDRICFCLAD